MEQAFLVLNFQQERLQSLNSLDLQKMGIGCLNLESQSLRFLCQVLSCGVKGESCPSLNG